MTNQVKKKLVMTEKAAEAEFFKWGEISDRDFSMKDLDDDDIASFKQMKRRIVEQMSKGHLKLTEEGYIKYKPHTSPGLSAELEFVFKPFTGQDYAAMDTVKKDKTQTKMHAMVAASLGVHINDINKLSGADYNVVMKAIVPLFLDE